ncbi:hypothetical protein PMI09_02664 [Rhizobium sp. CF122]|nr:hypothetical protein PMI09_02664 [Rhizobium sp. CF122]
MENALVFLSATRATKNLPHAIILFRTKRNFDFAFRDTTLKLHSADQYPTQEELFACPSTVAVSTS